MMVPARTAWPSNTFTPRRWALESRPLRVEPPPLVFDIWRSCSAPVAAGGDPGDLDGGVVLAVPVPAPLAGLGLVREPVDLGPLGLAHDPGGDGGSRQLGRRGQHGGAVDDQDGRERDLAAVAGTEALDVDALALGHPFLLAAGGDDCVHSEGRS